MTANAHCFMAAPRCFGDLSASHNHGTSPGQHQGGIAHCHPNAGDDCQQEVIHTLVVGEESSYSQLFDRGLTKHFSSGGLLPREYL